MGWRDTIVVPEKTVEIKKSWRDTLHMPEPEKPIGDISEIESATLGVVKGATMGWIDELAGAIEAAGSKVGLRGLGGSLTDVRLETDEEDKQSFADVYEQGRDARRSVYGQAEKQNPKSFMAGEIGGGVASGALLPLAAAGKAATVTGKIAAGAGVGAIEGAVQGAGYSEASPLSKDFAKDVGMSAGFGGVMGGAVSAAGQALPKVLKWGNSAIFDLDGEVTDAVLKNHKSLDGVRSLGDIEDDVVSAASNLRKAIAKKDTAIWNGLSTEPINSNAQFKIKVEMAQNINERLEKYGHIKIDADGKKFANPMDTSKKIIKKAEAVKELVNNSNLSESDLKRIIKSIDNEINWDKQDLEPINDFLQETRSSLDNILKEMNPDYKKAMQSQATDVRLLDDVGKQYRLKKVGSWSDDGLEFVATDTTARKLKTAKDSLKNTDQNNNLKDTLDKLSIYRSNEGGDALFEQGAENYSFLNDLNKRRLVDKASGGVTNGSRGVNLGAIGGGGVGVATGGMLGGAPGMLVGAGLGAARDKFGRAAATGLTRLVSQMKNNYGRQFEAATRRGGNAAAATHYLLYNKDQEYKRLYDEIQKAQQEEQE